MERTLRVGFTGTRDGMTEKQKAALRSILTTIRASHLHHGCCTGADAEAHEIAKVMGLGIEIHPSTDTKTQVRTLYPDCELLHEQKPALERNKDIVQATRVIVACPKTEAEELRSGTWATVRHARKQEDRSVVVITPEGKW
jgi:hypothetical protein